MNPETRYCSCDLIWFCFGKEKSHDRIKFEGTRWTLGREM